MKDIDIELFGDEWASGQLKWSGVGGKLCVLDLQLFCKFMIV